MKPSKKNRSSQTLCDIFVVGGFGLDGSGRACCPEILRFEDSMDSMGATYSIMLYGTDRENGFWGH